MILIQKAKIKHIKQTITFFEKHLKNNSNIYNLEFLCPLGIKSAIYRNQIIIALEKDQIIGALRYYKRKTKNKISLYQFAIEQKYQGKNLIKKMLKLTKAQNIESMCLKNKSLNNYYKKTGWKLDKTDEKFNYWILKNKNL